MKLPFNKIQKPNRSFQPIKPKKPMNTTPKYQSLKTIVKFAAKVASIVVDSVQKEQSQVLSAVLTLAPLAPNVLKELSNAKKEWLELQTDKDWNEIVATFKENFDIKNDVSELFIETLIDDVLIVLEYLLKIWDKAKNYIPKPSK